MLRELSGQKETHRSLDLAGRDGASLVVVREARSLGRDALEDVVDEGAAGRSDVSTVG